MSYFEWVQNLYGYYWSEDEVNVKLEEYMTKAFSDIERVRAQENTSYRKAAYILAVKRILEAEKARGRINGRNGKQAGKNKN